MFDARDLISGAFAERMQFRKSRSVRDGNKCKRRKRWHHFEQFCCQIGMG
jgi:hypothetical protein